MKLLLLGATGLVGRHVLARALDDARIEAVTAPSRRPLNPAPKLFAPVVDFNQLPADAPWWQADAMICTLGTTMRHAKTREAFRMVDHDHVLAAARLARSAGTPAFVLNSAMGADALSRIFYNRVKGETEHDLAALGFPSLTFVRPGLIGGERDEFRAMERMVSLVLRGLDPVLPKRWRINPAPVIAQALLEAAVAAQPGTHVVGSDELVA